MDTGAGMDSHTLGNVVRTLRQIATPVLGTDSDLLRTFALRRDGSAFAELVRRHGPMVLGVCRRVLRNSSDADDAFQATFLVLFRKAGSLRHPERLAGWLYQVAFRTARKLRATLLSQQARQVELFEIPAGESPAEFVWKELRPIFDDELSQLPEKLRLPAVLCLLEGCSKRDAARTLGWPEGTLSVRLQRARERLRSRFTKRGLTLSCGSLAVALFEGAGAAAVSESLLASTIHMTKGSLVSASVQALADGVTQAMFVSKLKTIAAGVLMAGVIGTETTAMVLPGSGPGQIVAGEPAKDATKGKSPGAGGDDGWRDAEVKNVLSEIALLRKQLEKEQAESAKADERAKDLAEKYRLKLIESVKVLREQVAELKRLVPLKKAKADDLDRTVIVLAEAEKQLKKLDAEVKFDPERAKLMREIELVKDRADWEAKMVKKGFLAESQLERTKDDLARLQAELAKRDAPKPKDPRVAAYETVVAKLEEIVKQTEEGVKKGIVPQQELLNSQATLARYKYELVDVTERAKERLANTRDQQYAIKPTKMNEPKVLDPRVAAMEATVSKLEEIVRQTEEMVKRGIVPQQELLNSQATLARYKYELVDLIEQAKECAAGARDPRRAALDAPDPREKAVAAEERKRIIGAIASELERAESPAGRKTTSAKAIRALQVRLSRLRADAAEAEGDYATSVREHEAIVAEGERGLAEAKKLFEQRTTFRAELREAERSLAEAKIGFHQGHIRSQLAQIVAHRTADLKDARKLLELKAISAVDFAQAERALEDAKLRLAEGR
jgi:RNA polymerase sigma factor (sigma-70 family)